MERNTRNPTQWARDGMAYLREVRAELGKVTWPSQKEYTGGTLGVLVVVAVIALVLATVDFGLSQILRWVVG